MSVYRQVMDELPLCGDVVLTARVGEELEGRLVSGYDRDDD